MERMGLAWADDNGSINDGCLWSIGACDDNTVAERQRDLCWMGLPHRILAVILVERKQAKADVAPTPFRISFMNKIRRHHRHSSILVNDNDGMGQWMGACSILGL